MANRFVGRIRSGEIGSVDDLKTEFKALAKLSHPDLLGPGADHRDFAALRDEYEAALRDFVRHRFGARRGAGVGAAAGPSSGRGHSDAPRGEASGSASDETWACFALLLKRGFPKVPRHEKEGLRYEYARWRLCEALGGEGAGRFEACEAELLALKSELPGAGSPIFRAALGLFRELVDYHGKGLPAMRTHILLSLGALGADPRIGPGYLSFVRDLAAGLGIGAEIPTSSR